MNDHVKVMKDTKFFEGTVDGDKLNHDGTSYQSYLVHTMYGYLVVPWYVSGYHPGPVTVK